MPSLQICGDIRSNARMLVFNRTNVATTSMKRSNVKQARFTTHPTHLKHKVHDKREQLHETICLSRCPAQVSGPFSATAEAF